jgi:site-specific DNA-methyltransferase (adenine-specific)
MLKKTLKRKEVELGFLRIPAKNRAELIGEMITPFNTKVNDFPAKVDKQGRLWCTELRNKYPINSEVELSKNETGFLVNLNGRHESQRNEIEQDNIAQPIIASTEASVNVQNQDETWTKVLGGDCIKLLEDGTIGNVHVTFFDPPYLQGKEYKYFDDKQSEEKYWDWVKTIIEGIYKTTVNGGAIYFMHREKNAEKILQIMRESSWNFQNLIIWKKKTSAVPIETRFSKQYQIVVYAIKGKKPRVFNKVRIDPPPLPEHKYKHENGVYLTDVWDDIRELTSGYFAGDEALRDHEGNRMHVQQTPVALLLRIILSSTMPGDTVFDPTAGTGTALIVAKQLYRNSIGVEIDPAHVELIKKRLAKLRRADEINNLRNYYQCTPKLNDIWKKSETTGEQSKLP